MSNIDLKKMRLISIIWGTILFLIFAALTTFGILYKKQTQEYKDFEKKIEEISKNYVEEKNLYFEKEGKITLEELKEENKIDSTEIKENECNGYVTINNMDYKAYISCGKYKTRGFKK